jgi:3-phenylpropionate/trans-cinnamate dioxygenase ferredoxin subunit
VTFTRACALNELEDGKPLAVTVDGVDIAVVRDEDAVYAVRDRCSHAEIPLSEGDVDGCLIECWLHGSSFDMRTGEPTSLPAFEPVAVFPVHLEGDDVLVDVANPTNNVTD